MPVNSLGVQLYSKSYNRLRRRLSQHPAGSRTIDECRCRAAKLDDDVTKAVVGFDFEAVGEVLWIGVGWNQRYFDVFLQIEWDLQKTPK